MHWSMRRHQGPLEWVLHGLTEAVQQFRARGRRRRALARTPLLAIDTPEGAVARATGIVRGTASLISPWSGRPCVAYRVRTPMQGEPGPFEASDLCAFELECPGARVRVVNPFFDLHGIANAPAATDGDAPHRWRDFLDEHGLSPDAAGEPSEQVIELGIELTVTGIAARELIMPTDELGFRDIAATLRLVGDYDRPLQLDLGRSPTRPDDSRR